MLNISRCHISTDLLGWQRLLLEPGLLKCTNGRTGKFPVGEIGSPQTATDVVAKQSLGSWLLLWSLNSHIGCGSTPPWFSCRDSPDKGSEMTVTTVHTPNSFIHLVYNSPYMDIVDMHNVMVTPSDSVLWEKTMEASYFVGSFPCQLSQISLTDIPVWDEVWEQATFRHLCTLW